MAWILMPHFCLAWGFWSHQQINRLAVFTLPQEMLVLYKVHIDFLAAHAVDPDKRRYVVEGEAAHHYIDLDHHGEYPFLNLPRSWQEAVDSIGKDRRSRKVCDTFLMASLFPISCHTESGCSG